METEYSELSATNPTENKTRKISEEQEKKSKQVQTANRNRSRSVVTRNIKYDINYIYFEEDQEIILNVSKNQRKMSNYNKESNVGYNSRNNILKWSEQLLSSINLKDFEKQSIFHRFSTAFDFLLYLQRESRTRPAPSELPQGRKAARAGGCSGAMC